MIGGQYRDVRPDEALDASGLERTSAAQDGSPARRFGRLRGDRREGADAGGVETARAFGVGLGLLFQIVDDILDETGSNEALGNQGGTDARRGRRTFLRLDAGAQAPAGARTRCLPSAPLRAARGLSSASDPRRRRPGARSRRVAELEGLSIGSTIREAAGWRAVRAVPVAAQSPCRTMRAADRCRFDRAGTDGLWLRVVEASPRWRRGLPVRPGSARSGDARRWGNAHRESR